MKKKLLVSWSPVQWFTRAARELNWARRAWSTDSDREFHDELYRGDRYDPFSAAYPGNTTIRRFADLVEPYVPARGFVLDLGCGPGEITCELAARRPDVEFLGIDHSTAAIDKARANAARRGTSNAQFEAADVEAYSPGRHADLVMLFDSFHHLTRPADFVTRLSPHVSRWTLIEPRGSWAGSWQKDLDLDWIAHDLDKIRARIAGAIGARGPVGLLAVAASAAKEGAIGAAGLPAVAASAAKEGAAIERRYTLDDLRRFFDGCALDLRGTIAGLETYPAGSHVEGELRDMFGELRYQLYRRLDDWLFEKNLDLHAKHWLVVAERGGRTRDVRLGNMPESDIADAGIAGQYDVRYRNYRGPLSAAAGERLVGTIELTNEGWDTWSTDRNHIFVSYHWLDASGRIVDFDGTRTPLPRPIPPGDTCDVTISITAPQRAGRYQLAIDLVREGVTWFSEAGHPWFTVQVDVR